MVSSVYQQQCALQARAASRVVDLEPAKRLAVMDMNDRLNPDIGRRSLLRVLGAAAGAAAASAAPLAAATTETASTAKKRRARYQANSPEVQTFYRVNRYPAK